MRLAECPSERQSSGATGFLLQSRQHTEPISMNSSQTPAFSRRSIFLMDRRESALLVIDVQERLLPLIDGGDLVVWNLERLMEGAAILGVPVQATEQYPEGLGPTVEPLRGRLGTVASKRMFSCRECSRELESLAERGVTSLLLAGIETHVCVQQTALDCLAAGFSVYIPVDAVGSRRAVDHHTALRRMENAGATLTTTESALFEWCETSAAPEFKAISGLVRRVPPASGS